MSHKNKKSMIRQVQDVLDSKLAIGESKHDAKLDGSAKSKIFSWATYRTYLAHGCIFGEWAKEMYGCRDLTEARELAGDYLQRQLDQGRSAHTIKTAASALAKIYGCSISDFGVNIPYRSRAAITRSRGPAVRDKGFSPERNQLLIALGECVGLRRAEMAALTGDKLISLESGQYAVLVNAGTKGGRVRISPVVGPVDQVALVVAAMKEAGP